MTKTILNGANDDDKDVIQSDQVSESNINDKDNESEAEELTDNGTKAENKENSDVTKNGETSKESQNQKDREYKEKVEKVKRKLKQPKTAVHLSSPHPIRKRRKTITESDYNQHKGEKCGAEEIKRLRAEKLRQIEENKKSAKESNEHTNEVNERIPFVPKVKNATVSRGDLLSSDMMASGSKS